MKPRDRLRIAMQKAGRLTEPAQDLLARCGLKFRQSRDKLFCFGEGEPVDLALLEANHARRPMPAVTANAPSDR